MSSANRTFKDMDHRGSRQIEREIENTRSEMDRTLDEIGDRLHPRHLVDEVLDLFRSSDGERSAFATEARRSGEQTLRKIRRNPIPALLVGAGIAYLMMDDEPDEPRQRGRRDEMDDRWSEDWPEKSRLNQKLAGQRDAWRQRDDSEQRDHWERESWQDEDQRDMPSAAAAWQNDYDWSDATFDEHSWTPRAESTVTELQSIISRSDMPPHQRIRTAASKVLELSGRSRSEIRRALRAQWDDIPEHSGSFVDARTGEPYDASYGKGYGQDWRQLAACDVLSRNKAEGAQSDGTTQEEDWQQHAGSTLESLQTALADTASTAKQKLSKVAEHLGSLGAQSRDYASHYSDQSRQGLQHLGSSARRGASAAGRQLGQGASSIRRGLSHGATATAHGAAATGRRLNSGYTASRDLVAETVEDHPLAAGAAVLGLGLLLGALLPRTRTEDNAFGSQSDQAKDEAKQAGQEMVEKGQQLASSAGEAAKDQLERQGLTPSQLASKAKETVNAVGETLAESETSGMGSARTQSQQPSGANKNSGESQRKASAPRQQAPH